MNTIFVFICIMDLTQKLLLYFFCFSCHLKQITLQKVKNDASVRKDYLKNALPDDWCVNHFSKRSPTFRAKYENILNIIYKTLWKRKTQFVKRKDKLCLIVIIKAKLEFKLMTKITGSRFLFCFTFY